MTQMAFCEQCKEVRDEVLQGLQQRIKLRNRVERCVPGDAFVIHSLTGQPTGVPVARRDRDLEDQPDERPYLQHECRMPSSASSMVSPAVHISPREKPRVLIFDLSL